MSMLLEIGFLMTVVAAVLGIYAILNSRLDFALIGFIVALMAVVAVLLEQNFCIAMETEKEIIACTHSVFGSYILAFAVAMLNGIVLIYAGFKGVIK